MQLTYILTGAFAILANAHWHHPHGYYYQQPKEAAPVVGSNPNQYTGSTNGSASGLGPGTGTGTDTGTGTGTGNRQQKEAAPIVGSNLNQNTGSTNGSVSGLGTGTGTGNYYQQQKKAAPVVRSNPNQNSGSVNGSASFLNTGTGTGTGTAGNDHSNPAPASPPQSSGSGTANPNSTPPSAGNNAGGSTASFTQYGPCNVDTTSCAWYSSSGYNAAISQAAYGGAPGSGASSACGVCWRLTPDFPGANEIVVKVNNLCPADGNPLCAQPAGEFSPPFFYLNCSVFVLVPLRHRISEIETRGLIDLRVHRRRYQFRSV